MTTPPFNPLPCDAGGQGAADDVESHILCALDANGSVLATALAVYTYDPQGNPVGPPTFVDPATGDPFVQPPGTTMQPCPNGDCGGPIQFCQTSTTTGPVEHPGRQYDITLPINPGFAVQSLQVDQVTSAAGIVWDVADPDGQQFAADLKSFIEGRVAGSTVTVTNPNVGQTICGTAAPMQVHIECLRLDRNPPNLIELVYNGGQDMVINPAYNETPPLNPPVSQGNYGFHLLGRQDNNTYPGNQPANRANCTNVANRGWETNDVGRTFEIWGQDIVQSSNVTPTPRGTPVQEMTSDGAPAGKLSTIWQTFTAPASANFIIRVVHGSRDPGETHRITLDNGDTDDQQNGHLIDDTTQPPSVTNAGGPNPWTQFSQTIPLTAGQTYTLALSSTNPVLYNRGGLFTDMRAYIDRPDLRATAVNNDDTCVVTTQETQTNTTCSFWQPQCTGGRVDGWVKVDTGLVLSNAQFWAQTPTPKCCTAEAAADGGGNSTLSNLAVSDIVCATIGGVPRNVVRQVVLDPSGGQLSQQFLDVNGAPVAPATWAPGPCTSNRTIADVVLCDFGNLDAQGQPTSFLRKFVQSLDAQNQGQVNSHRDFRLDGTQTYAAAGPVRECASATQVGREVVCWTQTSTGTTVHTGTIRHDDSLPAPGWVLFDQNTTPVSPTEPGLTFVPCSGTAVRDSESFILCDTNSAGTVTNRFIRTNTYDAAGAIVSTSDRTLAGAAYTLFAGGTVGLCTQPTALDLDFVAEVLCDGSGTQFLRRWTIRSSDGVVTATTNTTLAGASYTPSGTVGLCSDCCPVVTATGCTNTGSSRYVAIRGANGTITLQDAVTGAAITQANIVACPDQPVAVNTQHRLIADADAAWTPGADVTGRLTSVTYTVLSGTATVLDSNGTSATVPAGLTATWAVQDDHDTLTGPQSIDAVGGQTYVLCNQV